jgi:hypothetical protein
VGREERCHEETDQSYEPTNYNRRTGKTSHAGSLTLPPTGFNGVVALSREKKRSSLEWSDQLQEGSNGISA